MHIRIATLSTLVSKEWVLRLIDNHCLGSLSAEKGVTAIYFCIFHVDIV
jgi:hypothetical protein